MPRSFSSLSAFLDHGFDQVIDVRSPAEFAEDHVPGAISLPVLSDAERAEVGTIYKQVSPFDARKIGAALVARNAAAHIAGPLANRDGGWRPLVYCWRGGQRSGAFTSILQQIGWRAETVAGGYQAYRRLVHAALYDGTLPHRLVLLDGNTGTGKTDLLGRMAARGVQVIDLEGMARHRGSLLGAVPGGQPGQKAFETALAVALARLDPARPVVAEAESSKIGDRVLPPALWSAMRAAPRLVIEAPLEARARFLVESYADMVTDPAALRARIAPLRSLRGAAAVAGWEALIDARDHEGFAAAMMAQHYDPSYARSRAATEHAVLGTIRVERLDPAGREDAADRLVAHLRRWEAEAERVSQGAAAVTRRGAGG